MEQTLYVANMGDNSISVINIDEFSVIDTIKLDGCYSGIKKITSCCDELLVSCIYDSSIISLNLTTGLKRKFHVCSYPSDICIAEGYIYTACSDSNSVLMLSSEGELIASLKCGLSPVSLCINESFLFCAHEISRELCIISADDLYLIDKIKLANTPSCLLSFNNILLAACIDCENTTRGCLYIYDVLLRQAGRMVLGEVPNHMAYAGDGKVITVNSAEGTASICNIITGETRTLITGALPDSVCCTDKYIFISNVLDDCISVYDIDTYTKIASIKTGSEPCGMYIKSGC